MFSLETQILLNRFRCQAHLSDLERAEEEKEPGAEDSARRDQQEKDRRKYVEDGVKRLAEFERRASGKK